MASHPNAPPGLPPQLAELRWWPWSPRVSYERMRAEETALMTDLINGAPELALTVCFDVNIGPVGCELGDCDPALRAIAEATSRCRVDALAWDGQVLLLIELKPFALPTAVGQLLVYHCLLTSEELVALPIVPLLVCRAAHQATLSCGRTFEVPIAVVPPDPGEISLHSNFA